jgi:hypothetical protein
MGFSPFAQTSLDGSATIDKLLGDEAYNNIVLAMERLDLFEEVANMPVTSLMDYSPYSPDGVIRPLTEKLEEVLTITDFGASPDNTAAQNTAAIHKAMKHYLHIKLKMTLSVHLLTSERLT